MAGYYALFSKYAYKKVPFKSLKHESYFHFQLFFEDWSGRRRNLLSKIGFF